jgi:hypothetical protein
MVTSFENLEISAARQRSFNAQPNFTRTQRARFDIFDPDILAAMQHSGFHLRKLSLRPEAMSRLSTER